MKLSIAKPYLLGSLALAICALLPSCVDPYVTNGHGPYTTVSYGYGQEFRTLPSGYRVENVGPNRYYTHGGHYYQQRGGRYVIVEAPHHYGGGRYSQTIAHLPRGYHTVERGGNRYYQVNDRYYQRSGSGYVIVQRPR